MSRLGEGGETELPKWLLPLLGGGRPGGRGGGERRRGRASLSCSRRLLRSPSSLALTDGPAAPWGGLRTLVGGWGALLPPRRRDPKGGRSGLLSGWGRAGSLGKALSSPGGEGFTQICPSQGLVFSALI